MQILVFTPFQHAHTFLLKTNIMVWKHEYLDIKFILAFLTGCVHAGCITHTPSYVRLLQKSQLLCKTILVEQQRPCVPKLQRVSSIGSLRKPHKNLAIDFLQKIFKLNSTYVSVIGLIVCISFEGRTVSHAQSEFLQTYSVTTACVT